MSDIQTIGNDFSKVNVTNPIKLFPTVTSRRDHWVTNIVHISYNQSTGMHEYTTSSFITFGRLSDIEVLVGSDVREIRVQCSSMSISSVSPIQEHFSFNMRIDRLIMLNMVCRLINYKS